MSKRKGLSLEEKRDKVLEVFHQSSDVFILKDVEKLASKKGVVLQTIKDVLQSLVDDGLVHQEKIGVSNYFWSFPGEQAARLAADAERLRGEIAAAERRRADAEAAVQQAKRGKEDSDERAELTAELARLQGQVAGEARELEQFAASDPELLERLQEAVRYAKEAANRWQDNCMSLHCWCRKRFEGREADIDAFFKEQGYNENAPYLE